jgi:citrate lyase subunit beta / citryl-CoA lyase
MHIRPAMIQLDFIAPLFVPANRPDRFSKAASSGADAVILDLEDAVRPDDKDAARQAVTLGFTQLPVILRVNGAGTAWHDADLDAALHLRPAAIMVPKAALTPSLESLCQQAALRGIGVIALIETARGLADARHIAACAGITRLAFGSVDYAVDIGCEHTRAALAQARAELVLASRLADRIAPLDGVTTDIADVSRNEADARYSRELGFGGKLCIHPRQIPLVLESWRPTPEEIQWASRIARTEGAVAVDGEMVDEPVRARARTILARSKSAA